MILKAWAKFTLAAAASARHFSPMTQVTDLTGKLLLAMPSMGDTRFERAVVFMCMHSDEGAMGLVINKPAPDISFRALLKQLDINMKPGMPLPGLYIGGPVENGRGFVLHSTDYGRETGTLGVSDEIAMTATRDILNDIASGEGPRQVLTTLGYSGWGPGQLEGELQQNAWLTCDADMDLVFGTENNKKWEAGLKSLGISPLMLSAEGGRA